MRYIYMNYRINRGSSDMHEFNAVNLLTMICSALKAREYGNQTTLYCDYFTYDFMRERDLLTVWDVVDYQMLEQSFLREDYNLSYFFNTGKFVALLHEQAPCVLIDIDLIVWHDVSKFLKNKEAVFTHWESIYPVSPYYCKRSELPISEQYHWNPTWDFSMEATNTSFLYFKNDDIKNYFCNKALEYIKTNQMLKKDRYQPGMYFVEQRLFSMCLKEKKVWNHVFPLINTTWSPVKGKFTRKDQNQCWWEFYRPDSDQLITHTWIAKNEIQNNQLYQTYFCCTLICEILKIDFSYKEKLDSLPELKLYNQLLKKYKKVSVLIDMGIASKDL